MKVNVGFLALQIAGMFLVFALALFLPAGTLAWAAGWAFMIMFFSFTVAASIWLFKQNPDLLKERMEGLSKADEKSWDKALMTVIAIVFFAWLKFKNTVQGLLLKYKPISTQFKVIWCAK